MKYLGIDWATREHVVALVEEDGSELEVWSVAHTWPALREFLDRLADLGGPESLMIGIEPGAVRVTELLVAAGYTTYEINPKSADRFRDRSSPAGSKDDRRDALVLAHAVRTDHRLMRPARRLDERTVELRLRCRDRLAVLDARRRLIQQLHQVLAECFPAMLALGMPLWRPLVRALLRAYPSARLARGAQRRRLAALLKAHKIRRVDVEGLRALLHEESFPLSPGAEAAYTDRVRSLVAQLDQAQVCLDDVEEKIAALFEQHESHDILMSVPGVGAALAPYIAVEVAARLGESPTPGALQATAGTAPTTRRSGRQVQGSVRMRRACNRELQAALYSVARASRAKSEWARAYYAAARVRGLAHNAALRALSNKWAKILAVLLSRRELYDEERHVAELRRNGVAWAPKAEQGVAA